MTKAIIDELSNAKIVYTDLSKYLSKKNLSPTMIINGRDCEAFGNICCFFIEIYGIYIRITSSSIDLYKHDIMVMSIKIELPAEGKITLSIIMAIRYCNNPF